MVQDPTACFACVVAKTTVCSIACKPNLKPPAGMIIASTVAARSVDCGPLSIRKRSTGERAVYREAEPSWPCLPDYQKRGYGSDDPYDRSIC
ncbi:hypothetical protein HDV63DRAFT_390047 [Trichoderma sp. SZMC 28014]